MAMATAAASATIRAPCGRLPRGRRGCRPPPRLLPNFAALRRRLHDLRSLSVVQSARERVAARGERRVRAEG